MKGFYFSLDSLLASTVMLASFMMLISQPVDNPQKLESYKLDRVHLSNMQDLSSWNSSYNKSEKVSAYFTKRYYSGYSGEAENICKNYFNITENYAVYISNQTENSKICGTYNVEEVDTLITETSYIPDIRVNKTYTGPIKLTMVMEN